MSASATVQNPPSNASATETVASGLTTLSSHSDPYPHYIVGSACLGAAGYTFSQTRNTQAAAIAGALGLAFYYAGYLLSDVNRPMQDVRKIRQGYDIASIASVALAALAAPRAYRTGEVYSTVLGTLGVISSAGNLLKSYQLRTGKPRDMNVDADIRRNR